MRVGITLFTCVLDALIYFRWIDYILSGENNIIGRMDQLKDNRTWTIAVRCELLFQLRMISESLFSDIYLVRKARNHLVHEGKRPNIDVCEKMLGIILRLVSLINTKMKNENELSEVASSNLAIGSSGYRILKGNSKEVKESIAWRPLLPLPGDEEWGDRDFFDVADTHLVPIKHEEDK